MPMVYISKEAFDLLKQIENFLKQKAKPPNRVLRSDILKVALETYFEKIKRVKEND